MTSRPIPGAVRAASWALAAMALIGTALIVVGVLVIMWWGSSDAAGLQAIFGHVKQTYGLERPAMLRGIGGAQVLIACGIAGLVLAGLAWRVREGWQWAKTTAMILMVGLVVVVGADIGSDVIQTTSMVTYMTEVARFDPQGQVVRVADIEAVLYPGWYQWLEDIAQGALIITCAFVLLALAKASIWSEGYFQGRSDAKVVDAWGEKLARIRAENRSREG